MDEVLDETDPEYWMLSVCRVREDCRHRIPAVVHVDGTARVQLVTQEKNPLFRGLISALAQHTEIPVILNTSFNLRGEPIVNSPLDAIRTFEWSDMDYLVIGRHLIRKDL